MWCPSHFITIPLGYLIIGLAAFFSRRLSPEGRTRYVRILVLLLFLGELIKQISVWDNYSANYLPFHYSSTYYVSLALYAFGQGRVKHFGACVTYVGGLFLLATMTFNPEAVVGNTADMFASYYQAYSYFYHMLVLHLWLVMLFGNGYVRRRGDLLRYSCFLGVWMVLAIPAAFHFGMNYAGILRSFLPFLEKFRLQVGQAAYLALYACLTVIVAGVAIGLHMEISRLIERHKSKKESAASTSGN